MKKEIADKWVAALRSGKYKQGEGFLRKGENEFCCLGVLCDINQDVGQWEQINGNNYFTTEDDHDGIDTELTNYLRDHFDIGNVSEERLIRMNDATNEFKDNKHSFEEIADYIEANWEKL